ncbi:hypothetical protein VP01_1524g1, partial [Puccinia sorghi]
VAGFSSHSAKQFCLWCDFLKTDIAQMKMGRSQTQMKTTQMDRRDSDSLKKIGQTNWGANIRAQPIDILGSCVLQHHFRYCWGINGNIKKQTDKTQKRGKWELAKNVSLGCSIWNIDQKKKLISCLGKEKNSKLKASKWHTLFYIHLPLAEISVFVDSEPINKFLAKNKEVIKNFIAVVRCNIVGLDKLRKEDSENLTLEYSKYTSSAENIFPNIKILPNHHYPLHIPEQMRWWGLLLAVSEFPGKRLIGKLQKCKTNQNTSKWKQTPMTMMERFCQAQRLQALHGLDCALDKEKSIRGRAKFELSKGAYQEILGFCWQVTPDLWSCSDLPHPDGAKYDTTDGHSAYSQVTNVIQVTGYGWAGTTIIQLLPAREFQHSNFLGDILRRVLVLHVQLGTLRYIYPSQVVGPIAYRSLPAWTLCSSGLSYLIGLLTGLSETLWPVNNDAIIIDL